MEEKKADYIKCEPIGGGYPRHLNTFSNFFNFIIVGRTLHTHQYTLHTHQYTLGSVAIVLTVSLYTMFSKISEHKILASLDLGVE